MSSAKFSSTVLLLTFALFVRTSFGANFVFHFCSSSETFTTNSPYESNLKRLIDLLIVETPQSGFNLSLVGQYHDQRAYGLSLCRGDVSAPDCKTCLSEASSEIRKRCPQNRGAIVWYDTCLFKYSDKDFFGQIDNINKFSLVNGYKVDDPSTFNGKIKEEFTQLAEKASLDPKMFAAGQMKLEGSMTIYGLTECSRDLSSMDCKKCLDGAISELPNCCDGQKGARFYFGSCNVRYEMYPFF